MVRVLVTGGAGYIGCILVPRLLASGYKVRVLDLFRHRSPGLAWLCDSPDFEPIRGDCRDAHTIRECLKNVDYIIPLAAVVGAPACDADPYTAIATNLGAITCLLGERGKDQRILYPTTNSGYGTSEDYATEDSPLNPVSLYGRTKNEAEQSILEAGNCITFRLATAFGCSPRMRLDLLVNDFVWRAVRDRSLILYEPDHRRNCIHIRDVADVFVHGMSSPDIWRYMNGRAYNVALPEGNLTKWQLCDVIRKVIPEFHSPSHALGTDPDKRDCFVSTKRIQGAGFWCKVGLEEGIRELVKAYTMFPPGEMRNA